MTTLPETLDETSQPQHRGVDRRGLLRTAGALAATTMLAPNALARDYGRNAEPTRYPDPDIVVIDPKRSQETNPCERSNARNSTRRSK